MSKPLPFKTQPRQANRLVGNPDIGELEFPSYGSLLWFEREALRRADAGFSLFKAIATVAVEMAQAESLPSLEAQEMVTRILQESLGVRKGLPLTLQEQELRTKYSSPLGVLLDASLAWNDRRQLAVVTAVIANRLSGCSDWSEDDTRQLGELLIAEIYAFVQTEEGASAQDSSPEELERKMAEDLGKLPPVPGSHPPNPTGSGSTGDYEPSTPEPLSSDQTALVLTPSTTSSAPSKPASSKSAKGSSALSSPSLS